MIKFLGDKNKTRYYIYFQIIFIIFLLNSFINSAFSQSVNNTKQTQRLKLKANNVDFINATEGKRIINAKGGVEASYTNYKLFCDHLKLDELKDEIIATGNVTVKESSGAVLKATKIKTNKENSKATVENMILEQGMAHSKAKLGEKDNGVYFLKDVIFSTCGDIKQDKAQWHFKAKKVEYNTETENVYAYNTFFYLKDVPVMWLPFANINPNRTHGFLAPSMGRTNGQYWLSTPYFISEKTKSHYFEITPQFYFNKSGVENDSRASNYELLYQYNKNGNNAYLKWKIAPNAYIADLPENSPLSNEKANRWYYDSNLTLNYKSGSYGGEFHDFSDKNVRLIYDGIFENYLTNRAFVNYFSNDNKHSASLESIGFKPIAINDTLGNIPTVEVMGEYNYSNAILNGLYKTSLTFISFKNDSDKYYKRVSNSQSIVFDKKFLLNDEGNLFIKSSVQPEVRFDYYAKSYKSISDLTKNANDDYLRAIPSVFITNSVPINFRIKNNKKFLFTFEPMQNILYIKENMNNGRIINEDSAISILTHANIMNKSYIAGYDLIDGGLSLVFGGKLKVEYIPKSINVELFIGRKVKKYFEEDKPFEKSDYVGSASLSALNIFKIGANAIYSSKARVQQLNSYSSISYGILTLNYTQNLTKKPLLPFAVVDSKESKYSARVKVPDSNFTLTTSATKNHNFLNEDGSTSSKITLFEAGILYMVDCLEIEFGARRLNATNIKSENTVGFYGKFKIIAK